MNGMGLNVKGEWTLATFFDNLEGENVTQKRENKPIGGFYRSL